jgi:hypothetical protein
MPPIALIEKTDCLLGIPIVPEIIVDFLTNELQ